MPALLTPRTRPTSRFSRPCLEMLEDRAVPATIAMSIVSITANWVTIQGQLSDAPDVAFEPINFSGAATGSTNTNATGGFSAVFLVPQAGILNAFTPIDPEAMAALLLGWEKPVMTEFDAIEGQNSVYTFKGKVTFSHPFETMTIKLGGVPITIQNKTATANAAGSFEKVLVLNGLDSDNGTVWAKAVSPFGVESDPIFDYVHQTGT